MRAAGWFWRTTTTKFSSNNGMALKFLGQVPDPTDSQIEIVRAERVKASDPDGKLKRDTTRPSGWLAPATPATERDRP
jgi:hypothetical protein